MAKSLEQIAKAAAMEIILTSWVDGYERRPERSMFFYSDMLDLEARILDWLIEYMQLEDE
jgi:hypothetical protein